MTNRAFTLLELIIVLALLAIIASVAVARFVDLHNKIYEVQENSTIAALRSAVLLYKGKNGMWPRSIPLCSPQDVANSVSNCPASANDVLLENLPPWAWNAWPTDTLPPNDWTVCQLEAGDPCAVPNTSVGWWMLCPHADWRDASRNGNVFIYYFDGPCAGQIIKNPPGIYYSFRAHR